MSPAKALRGARRAAAAKAPASKCFRRSTFPCALTLVASLLKSSLLMDGALLLGLPLLAKPTDEKDVSALFPARRDAIACAGTYLPSAAVSIADIKKTLRKDIAKKASESCLKDQMSFPIQMDVC